MKSVVVFDQVSLEVVDRGIRRTILRNVSFKVDRGENFYIIGASGAGKSTILRLTVGLVKASSGRIELLGRDLSKLTLNELNALRRRTGFVFQYSALFDFLSVYDNVAFPLRLQGRSEEEINQRVIHLLRELGIEDAKDLYPYELSGGMRKRVALARAVASDPELILYDEPTSGLDPVMADVIDRIIYDFNRRGVTNVVVTHDIHSALSYATTIAFIHKGELRFIGSPEEALRAEDKLLKEFIEKGLRAARKML